jgi:predicted nuclease with TOPRIM domain
VKIIREELRQQVRKGESYLNDKIEQVTLRVVQYEQYLSKLQSTFNDELFSSSNNQDSLVKEYKKDVSSVNEKLDQLLKSRDKGEEQLSDLRESFNSIISFFNILNGLLKS